jgi:hypothetical protein
MQLRKIKDRNVVDHKTRVDIAIGFLFTVPIYVVLGGFVYTCVVYAERGVLIKFQGLFGLPVFWILVYKTFLMETVRVPDSIGVLSLVRPCSRYTSVLSVRFCWWTLCYVALLSWLMVWTVNKKSSIIPTLFLWSTTFLFFILHTCMLFTHILYILLASPFSSTLCNAYTNLYIF